MLAAIAALLTGVAIGGGSALLVLFPAAIGVALFALSLRHTLHQVPGRQAGVRGLVALTAGIAVSAAATALSATPTPAFVLAGLAIVVAGCAVRAQGIVHRVRKPLFDGYTS